MAKTARQDGDPLFELCRSLPGVTEDVIARILYPGIRPESNHAIGYSLPESDLGIRILLLTLRARMEKGEVRGLVEDLNCKVPLETREREFGSSTASDF